MILTTRGWSGASIVYTHASGAGTYTVSADTLNAYDVAVALRAWLDDAARPWAGDISGVTLTVEADDDDVRVRFVYAFTGSTPTFVSVVPNATWIANFGDTSASPVTGCAASCSAIPGTMPWVQWDAEEGETSRGGSWRFGHPLASHYRPAVAYELTRAQSFALNAAIRSASQPRTAYIYSEITSTWRKVRVGPHEFSDHETDPGLILATFDVLGEAA